VVLAVALRDLFVNSVLIDNDDVYMQVEQPFWFRTTGFARLFEFFVIVLFAILLASDEYRLYVLYVMGFFWLLGMLAAFSRKNVSYFDKKNNKFVVGKYCLGLKMAEYVWDLGVFEGVSYGIHYRYRGGNDGVRLHALNGKYVLNFMIGNKESSAKEMAGKISKYSSLNCIGNIETGTQHKFDDLRGTV
jgi:hypothetical protein